MSSMDDDALKAGQAANIAIDDANAEANALTVKSAKADVVSQMPVPPKC